MPNRDSSSTSQIPAADPASTLTPSDGSGKSVKGRRRKKADKAGVIFGEGDLRGIIASADTYTPKLHPYYALLNAGVIKKPMEFLSTVKQDSNPAKEGMIE
jgi:hypothetical protein